MSDNVSKEFTEFFEFMKTVSDSISMPREDWAFAGGYICGCYFRMFQECIDHGADTFRAYVLIEDSTVEPDADVWPAFYTPTEIQEWIATQPKETKDV
jgi:hypothetical protein